MGIDYNRFINTTWSNCIYTNDTSPFRLISSSLGESTLSLAVVREDLVATLSGSHLDTIINAKSNPYTMGGEADNI